MEVHVSWSAERGASRYRFQLARDHEFSDIVIDRVVNGTSADAIDLRPGKYFWRVAALDGRLGEFSTPRMVTASKMETIDAEPELVEPVRLPTPLPRVTPAPRSTPQNPSYAWPFAVDGGWRAAIGNVSRPMLAHLRSPNSVEIVAMNSDGVVFAIDVTTGVTLWATRTMSASRNNAKPATLFLVTVPSGNGLDNIVIPFESGVRALNGSTGRELWRVPLTSAGTNGVAVGSGTAGVVFLFSNSAQRLVILDSANGKLLAEGKLPARVVGAPVPFVHKGVQGALFGFEDGRVEVRDRSGNVVRAGSVNSAAMTPPLFVSGQRSLVLVGARNGLNALDADNLKSLGRVALNNDSPRGTLTSADLDGNGAADIVMVTERGQVMAVNAVDGKTLWEYSGAASAEIAAIVDLNGDGAQDVIVPAGGTFGMALSGRDGSVIWKDDQAASGAAIISRGMLAVRANTRTTIIGADPTGASLRAVHLSPRH